MKFPATTLKLAVIISVFFVTATAQAYQWPEICGGITGGPMIMPEIWFDGTNVYVTNENEQPWPPFAWSQVPFLRALPNDDPNDPNDPNGFDPTEECYILTGKAYNYQYGWDSALLYEYPPYGSDFWIKVLNQSPELETYCGDATYDPIFGTLKADGNASPDIWMWNMGMMHNVYAVPDDFYGRLTASYKIYIGYTSDGNELVDAGGQPIYGSAYITFNWLRPCPYILQGDFNADCIVDLHDYSLVANQWMNSCTTPYWCDECDIGHTSSVDLNDLALMVDNWLYDCQMTPNNPPCVPRPGPL